MHASSPLPSPPLRGSGASPNSAPAAPASPDGGSRLLEAHARLAAIDPWSGRERLFDEVLTSLVAGSGASGGALLDPFQPARSASAGLTAAAGVLETLASRVAASPRAAAEPLAPSELALLFGDGRAPFAIPILAQEDTLAFLVLGEAPEDPAGFASVTAHAAWLLDAVRMAATLQKADAGVAFPPEDGHALAEAVRALKNDPASLARLGDNGRRFVERECSRAMLAGRYAELLRSCCARS